MEPLNGSRDYDILEVLAEDQNMHIFCLMGKSAVGKDTVYQKLLVKFPMLHPLVPYVTRPQRQGEEEGREYHSVGEEQSLYLREGGRMIGERAYRAEKGFWRYGSVVEGKAEIVSRIDIGTLESYQKFCAYFGRERIIPFYLEVTAGGRLLRGSRRRKKEVEPCYLELVHRSQADEVDYTEEKLSAAGIQKRYGNLDLEHYLDKLHEIVLQYVRF